MFNQTFELHDLIVIGFLIVLEGVLSIDNALVLGLLARRVPKRLQSRALTYGLVGAFVFRFVAIALAQFLLRWWLAKLIGGAYLIYISIKYFVSEKGHEVDEKISLTNDQQPVLFDEETGQPLNAEQAENEIAHRSPVPLPASKEGSESTSPSKAAAARLIDGTAGFWSTVLVIELTDIAFAIDSILAAIAMVGSPPKGHEGLHPKFWVILTGGIVGLALMRVAAVMFIRLLERFPRLEMSAYLLVFVIGAKLCIDWGFNQPGEHPHVDFHNPKSPAFIIFWLTMVACFLIGFIPKKDKATATGG